MDVNFLAVIVAAIATFVVGALWYSPLMFADAWMSAHGYSKEKLEAMKRARSPVQGMATSFVCFLVMAFVLDVLATWTGVDDIGEGISLGILLWLGFAATLGLVANSFSDKPLSAFVIDTGYHFGGLALTGAIIGAWA
jgi:hypothetical protein